ncbi:unnamed protein product, partial [Meganyctiphanes norvegica]
MSESFVKEQLGANYTNNINDYTITNWKKDVGSRPDERYYPQEDLRKSCDGIFEVNAKEVIEENMEMIKGQYVEIQFKEGIDTNARPSSTESVYKCSHCDKIFSLRCNLVRHIEIHCGVKPYHCSLCSKSFSHNRYLVVHQRTHNKEKPYKCSQCVKAFSTKTKCISHQITHTVE